MPTRSTCLDSEDLEVEVGCGEPVLGPVREVVASRNGTACALALTYAEELSEGRSSCDRRLNAVSFSFLHILRSLRLRKTYLVGPGVCADLIRSAIGRDCSQLLGIGARIVGAVRLHDIVLCLRAVDPSIDSQVRSRAAC